jgi:hypothetical protein
MRVIPHRFKLQPAAVKGESFSFAPVEQQLGDYRELVVTLEITAAECGNEDETYDFYIVTENRAEARWDLVHFAQIVSDEAYSLVARIHKDLLPQQVTTAGPGAAYVESGTLAVATGQLNAIKSLAAGRVRHGPWGDKIGYELVVAGAVAPSIAYSISVEARY